LVSSPAFAFLDASALIYLVEAGEPFAARVRRELGALLESAPSTAVALSRLTWLECRIRPLREGDTQVLAAFDAFFARPDIVWVELDAQVVELATAIRALARLKTPDALQAACCLQLGPAHHFVTGDAAFRKVKGLNVRLLK
jgi:predicted nucleic acid-binding protein